MNEGLLQLRIENFRAFRDTGYLPIGKLTCVVGSNSSGKSSFLSALMLLKQSVEQKVISATFSPLYLSGPYCDLGSFKDIVHGHNQQSTVKFGLDVPIACLKEAYPPIPVDNRSIIGVTLPKSPTYSRRPYFIDLDIKHLSAVESESVRLELEFSTDEPFGPSLSNIVIDAGEAGRIDCTRTIKDGQRREHWKTYATGIPRQSIRLLFSNYAFFPLIRARENKQISSKDRRNINRFTVLCELIFRYIQTTLTHTELIGPFRTPPERRYQFGGFNISQVGVSGSNAIDLLITENLLHAKNPTLQDNVNYWLRHLGLATKLNISAIAKNLNLFTVNVSRRGEPYDINLADVGFGISQILPVIMQGLLMRSGGIFIVQQPEIHLHPDAQAGLADFFIYLSNKGVTVLLETHSEYLLVRLRRRMAEGKLKLKRLPHSETGIPFETIGVPSEKIRALVTENSKNNGPTIRELQINRSFQFQNLPPGFMNQAVDDRMGILAAISKR